MPGRVRGQSMHALGHDLLGREWLQLVRTRRRRRLHQDELFHRLSERQRVQRRRLLGRLYLRTTRSRRVAIDAPPAPAEPTAARLAMEPAAASSVIKATTTVVACASRTASPRPAATVARRVRRTLTAAPSVSMRRAASRVTRPITTAKAGRRVAVGGSRSGAATRTTSSSWPPRSRTPPGSISSSASPAIGTEHLSTRIGTDLVTASDVTKDRNGALYAFFFDDNNDPVVLY